MSLQDITWQLITLSLLLRKLPEHVLKINNISPLKMMVQRVQAPFEMLPFYMLNFRGAYIWPHLMYSEIYAPLQLPREFNDPNQLTRTLSSWDTLSLWSASPSVPPSWENQTRYVYTRICASEKITGDIIHQPFWQDMKGHESLFSIVQNDHNYLWRSVSHCHWCLPLGAMNKPILIALIHAFDIHETHLTESTFQLSSNDNSEYEIGDAVPATFRCFLNCCSTLIFRSKRGSHHWRALSSQKCHCKISPDT